MTNNTKNVEWTQPIEAVHEDGRVSSVRLFGGPYSGGCYYIQGLGWAYFRADGTHIGDGCPWTIRNVAEAKAVEAPETHRQGTKGVRTSQECLERMEALVRRMALADKAEFLVMGTGCREAYAEADAIAALLPEPVDPDLALAKEIMESRYYINDPEWQGDLDTTRAFKLLKRGRALQLGEG